MSVVRRRHHLIYVAHELAHMNRAQMIVELAQRHLLDLCGALARLLVVARSHLIVQERIDFGVVALEAGAQEFSVVAKARTIGVLGEAERFDGRFFDAVIYVNLVEIE